jgi:hypothetical protein
MTTDHASHWDDVFREEFAKESDRASVILSVALLDHALESILKARLVPIGSAEDSLFEGAYAPISTFSARIDLAYRLGLVSTKLSRDLHLIRKIRNEFAHNITGCTFQSSSVRSRVIELMRSSGIAERMPNVRKTFPEGPRGDFQMTISWILWILWSVTKETKAIESTELEWGYWSAEKRQGEDDTKSRT